MQAASRTLDLRGDETRGWAIAHQMNCRARLKESERAYGLYQKFIAERTFPNLWTWQPPFQIDGSLGTMAGVVEMLLQSHGEYIEILPALPKAWSYGSFDGLVARGNFVVSVKWEDGTVDAISITSRSGGECRIAYPDIESAEVEDSKGKKIDTICDIEGRIKFAAGKGETYTVIF
jgi:alpha-L-fucosidase 2